MGLEHEKSVSNKNKESINKSPRFPKIGFLTKEIGPSEEFDSVISTNSKSLLCHACGHKVETNSIEKPKDGTFFNIEGLIIVNKSCGAFLDRLIDVGIDIKTIERALKHPEWKTSQAMFEKVQRDIVDRINNPQ